MWTICSLKVPPNSNHSVILWGKAKGIRISPEGSHYLLFCLATQRELPALCHCAAHSRRVCHRVSGNRPAGSYPHSLSLQWYLPLWLRKTEGGTDNLCNPKNGEGEWPWSCVSSTRPGKEECFCKGPERIRDNFRRDACCCCDTLSFCGGYRHWYC